MIRHLGARLFVKLLRDPGLHFPTVLYFRFWRMFGERGSHSQEHLEKNIEVIKQDFLLKGLRKK